MPIDFAAIAARFGEQLAFEARRAVIAQREVGRVLGKRREAARAVERATRMFPIVRFHEDAVTLVLAESQRGALALSAPPPAFADQLARGAMGFLEGLTRVAEPFRAETQETAVSRFAGGVDRAFEEAVASMERFERATPDMFDPHRLGAGDLTGLATLGWRALVDASRRAGDVRRLTGQLGRALAILDVPVGPAAPPDGPVRSLGERLDAAAHTLVGAGMAVGALPRVLAVLLKAVDIRVRVGVLDMLSAIEHLVLDLRGSLLRRATVSVVAWADRMLRVVGAVHEVVGANVSFMLRFWRRLGTEFGDGVRRFAIGLAGFLRGVVDIMRAIPAVLDALVRFDLTSLVTGSLAQAGARAAIGRFTLADTLDATGRRVNVDLAERIWLELDAAQILTDDLRRRAWPFLGDRFDYADRQIARARWLVNELFPGWSGPGPHTILVPPEAPPLAFRSDFPDLYRTLFGGGRAGRLIGALDRLQAGLESGVGATLERARDGLLDLSRELGTAARAAVRVDRGRLERVGERASAAAARVFGPEVRRERAALAERPEDAVARAFESWLATGGFLTVGAAIPVYVDEVARHWREQVARAEELTAPITPTSPHILRRRVTLGRVALPRLTLRAPAGRQLDVALADEVAARFSSAVSDAYETGHRRLAELAALPGD